MYENARNRKLKNDWLVIGLANPRVKILSLSEGTSVITLCNTLAL